MSLTKLEKLEHLNTIIDKKTLFETQTHNTDQHSHYHTKRKSTTKIINTHPALLTNYSTKFIRKNSDNSKSPIAQTNTEIHKSTTNLHSRKRKSMVHQPTQPEEPIKDPRYSSPQKNILRRGLENSIQQEINRIKSLSRFMLDMKLPAALPSKPKKIKKVPEVEDKNPEQKPAISVKIQRTNGFIRPIMCVRERSEVSIEHKESAERRPKTILKSKQKLKTAPQNVEFGLHIRSHQEAFEQQTKIKEAKKELVKRFRSTWMRKSSRSKKLPEIEVSPWIVTEPELFD